jgi:hypothetical protein
LARKSVRRVALDSIWLVRRRQEADETENRPVPASTLYFGQHKSNFSKEHSRNSDAFSVCRLGFLLDAKQSMQLILVESLPPFACLGAPWRPRAPVPVLVRTNSARTSQFPATRKRRDRAPALQHAYVFQDAYGCRSLCSAHKWTPYVE